MAMEKYLCCPMNELVSINVTVNESLTYECLLGKKKKCFVTSTMYKLMVVPEAAVCPMLYDTEFWNLVNLTFESKTF